MGRGIGRASKYLFRPEKEAGQGVQLSQLTSYYLLTTLRKIQILFWLKDVLTRVTVIMVDCPRQNEIGTGSNKTHISKGIFSGENL